jgi:hypothetical protein
VGLKERSKNIAQNSAKNLGARLALAGASQRHIESKCGFLALAGACWRLLALGIAASEI